MIRIEPIKLIFAGIVFLLICLSLITYWNLDNYTEEVRWVRHSNLVLSELQNILSSIKDAETGHRGYQLTRDTSFLEPYRNSRVSMYTHYKRLDSLLLDQQNQKSKSDSLKLLIDRQFNIIKSILENTYNKDTISSSMDVYEKNLVILGKSNMDNIKSVAHTMVESESKILDQRLRSEHDFRSIAPLTLLVYCLLALGGATFLFVKVNSELNKRKKTEQELKQNIHALHREATMRKFTERSLRSVLDCSLNGIMAFKAIRNNGGEIVDFQWTMANAIGASFAGKGEDELVGKRLLQLLPYHKEIGLFHIYQTVVETGVTRQFEQLYQGDGINNWFYITAVRLDDGFVVTFSDITSQKLQQIERAEHNFLLKEAEDVAYMGSWSFDYETKRMVWSDGLYQIYQRSRAAFVPDVDSLMDHIYIEDEPLLREGLAKAFAEQKQFKIDYRLVIDDNFKYLKITGRPRLNVTGGYAGFLGTVEDVSEERINALRLKHHADELKRSNEELEQFAYVASHDLQEPLRKIRAFGDRLKQKYADQLEKTGTDYIERMQQAATRMQNLIEDLLSFSLVSRNRKQFQVVDLNEVIGVLLDDLEVYIDQQDATVNIGELPVLRGDSLQLKRLFQNLLSNAIKFHHPERKPVIEIDAVKVTKELAEAEFTQPLQHELYHRVSVKDNGIGFDEKYSEKIFNIFQRLHGHAEYEGTGIGLAISKKVVTNHDGYIIVHSRQSEGAEFVLLFPV